MSKDVASLMENVPATPQSGTSSTSTDSKYDMTLSWFDALHNVLNDALSNEANSIELAKNVALTNIDSDSVVEDNNIKSANSVSYANTLVKNEVVHTLGDGDGPSQDSSANTNIATEASNNSPGRTKFSSLYRRFSMSGISSK